MLRRNFFQIFAFVPALFASKVEAKQEEQIFWIGNDKYFCRNNKAFRLETESETIWYNELGQRHREDGPAIERTPAIERIDGFKAWYKNDKCHREDGPAFEWANGDKEWFLNGIRHRIDGPAVERVDGSKEWWVNGVLHRENGPAIEWANGNKSWYLNGVGQPVSVRYAAWKAKQKLE